ncbi:MAG: DoxX family protein [Bacteroidales bacterium]|nr:DoxX family protein [Bacteroidales bacterium]
MKLLNNISKVLVGLVFIFSGFVKAVDPLGSTYKFVDYFEAFGMDFLSFLAFPLAIVLSAIEFVIGVSLLLGTRRKLTIWTLTLFMGFFTILTFILAIYNPVTDCGCFGDAIIMTNWQTFGKNVILMIFTIFLFMHKDKFEVQWKATKQWGILAIPSIFCIMISVYCYYNLPVIDFRPYKVGTYIPEKMEIPEGAPTAEYETILVYKKDGVEKEFDMQNLPDSTWQWISTENKLISEGYVPPIHDFTIETLDGDDITESVLNSNKFIFMLITHDLEKTNVSRISEINKFALGAIESSKCEFICMTSSVSSEISEFKDKTHAPYLFYNTDEITLKTIVRANPGLVLLKDGTVIAKWHYNNIPNFDEIKTNYINNSAYNNTKETEADRALARN